jgi:hypothetical protein
MPRSNASGDSSRGIVSYAYRDNQDLKKMQLPLTGESDVTRPRIFDNPFEILVPGDCDCEFRHRNHTRYRDCAFCTEAVAGILNVFDSTHM